MLKLPPTEASAEFRTENYININEDIYRIK